jgi:hypothetical protein
VRTRKRGNGGSSIGSWKEWNDGEAKHLGLFASGQDARRLRKKMREWNPRNGFSAAFAEPVS